jgi:hypothetical protein
LIQPIDRQASLRHWVFQRCASGKRKDGQQAFARSPRIQNGHRQQPPAHTDQHTTTR